MKTNDCITSLEFLFGHRRPVLLTGRPGIGKTDVIKQSTANLNYELRIAHPVVDDPTDYKGMPWVIDGKALFLPFGNLDLLIEAKSPLVFFLDDLGQASPSVQSSCMQLLLARSINGHLISDYVTFAAATNRRQDNANVSGMLWPLLDRFTDIIELEYDSNQWVKWALSHNMPTELISFIQFRPSILENSIPSKEIVKVATPRSAEAVGDIINDGLMNFSESLQYELIKGAAGQAFAVEFTAFHKLIANLPAISLIFSDPRNTILPTEVGAQYALVGAIAEKLESTNIGNAIIYLERMAPELGFACLTIAKQRKPNIVNNSQYLNYIIKHQNLMTA